MTRRTESGPSPTELAITQFGKKVFPQGWEHERRRLDFLRMAIGDLEWELTQAVANFKRILENAEDDYELAISAEECANAVGRLGWIQHWFLEASLALWSRANAIRPWPKYRRDPNEIKTVEQLAEVIAENWNRKKRQAPAVGYEGRPPAHQRRD